MFAVDGSAAGPRVLLVMLVAVVVGIFTVPDMRKKFRSGSDRRLQAILFVVVLVVGGLAALYFGSR